MRLVAGVSIDITERKKAELELQKSREQLRALSARLQIVREEEATRIAREIHDVLGQTLVSLAIDVDWLEGYLAKEEKGRLGPKLRQHFRQMKSLLLAGSKTVQRVATDLRPSMLNDLGLAATLEWAAAQWERRTGIPCRWKQKPKPMVLNRNQATALFRIFQEILTNISRHARAKSVSCSLRSLKGELRLQVTDDGKGFNPGKIADRKSLGLIGMRERALLLGGQVELVSTRGKGTSITVRIPFALAKPAAARAVSYAA